MAWNDALIELVTDKWKPKRDLVGHHSNFNAIAVEADKLISKDVKKPLIGYFLIFIFAHIVLFKNSPVFSKAHLATGSIISVVMSIVTAFGLAQLFGVKFNLVVQTLPFILLGLGMDDTFVIMGAYDSTCIDLTIEDRIAATMTRAVGVADTQLFFFLALFHEASQKKHGSFKTINHCSSSVTLPQSNSHEFRILMANNLGVFIVHVHKSVCFL